MPDRTSAAGYQVEILAGLVTAVRLDPRTAEHSLLVAKHDDQALRCAAGAILTAAGHEPSDEDRALFVARFLADFEARPVGSVRTMHEADVREWIATRRRGAVAEVAPSIGFVISVAPRLAAPVAVTQIVGVGDERAVALRGEALVDAVDAILRCHTGRDWPIPAVERFTRHLFDRFVGQTGVVEVTIQAATIDRFVSEAQRAAD